MVDDFQCSLLILTAKLETHIKMHGVQFSSVAGDEVGLGFAPRIQQN
jgi:hypothetical protein